MTQHDQAAVGSSVPSRAARERALLAGRLADPALLDQAVEIQLGEDGSADTCLAVPVGGMRVAGKVTVAGAGRALRVLQALHGKPGFPCLRDFSAAGSLDDPHTIKWGLSSDFMDDHGELRTRMWGYHKAAVSAYVTEQKARDPRVPVTPVLESMTSAPADGRVYDVLLGGWDHYLADRRLVESLTAQDRRTLEVAAAINRAHQPAVVKTFASRGIDQYLDLGCGLPVTDARPLDGAPSYAALHDLVAQYRGDTARTVYVDHDTFIFAKVRDHLEDDPRRPKWVCADIRHMEQFLNSGRMQYLLDWSRPIGVLLHDVLPWIDSDETVAETMAVLRERLAPGSALSITHAANFGEDIAMSRFTKLFRRNGLAFKPRDTRAIGELFGNWPLEKPGRLVPTHRWHPKHPHVAHEFWEAGALAGLAFKPQRTNCG
ncbi:DUF6302 family protein [Streptomyces murinus]|uniref:DUF6302 family protein n=1 Tax=Streptomyces murinus TaxID=33900 RepID=UPI00381AA943